MKSEPIKGHCGNPTAPFPKPLADYVQTDRSGYVSFCYPGECGVFIAQLSAINDQLRRVPMHRRAKDRDAELKKVIEFVLLAKREHDLIDLQWTAHRDAIDAQWEITKAKEGRAA
jgi:hypothetical protein